MANSTLTALKAIHRQAELGRLFAQAEVPRLAVYHYRKLLELYHAAPDDVRKAAQTAYEEAGAKLVELEAELPEAKSEPPKSNVVLLWLYRYKKNSKLRGYGDIR